MKQKREFRIAAVLTVGCAALVAGAGIASAAPSAPATARKWHTYKTQVTGEANLVGVTAPGRDDAWASGFLVRFGANTALAARSRASRRSAADSTECEGSASLPSLMVHWNGHTWASVPVPNVSRINQVSASSATDGWAAADCGLLRWNGRRWAVSSYAAQPGPATQQVAVQAVKADGPKDGWLIGATYDAPTGASGGFVQRWNGRRWQAVPTPNFGNDYNFDSIDARGPRDVWVAGVDYHGDAVKPARPERLLLLHWDGRRWTRTTEPSTGDWTKMVGGLRVLGGNDVWVVGNGNHGSSDPIRRRPLALHWDGRRWTSMPTPSGPGELYDMTAANGGLAVGDTFTPGAATVGMQALRWSAGRWVSGPVPERGPGMLSAVVPIPGGGLWAVGAVGDGKPYPVIARQS